MVLRDAEYPFTLRRALQTFDNFRTTRMPVSKGDGIFRSSG